MHVAITVRPLAKILPSQWQMHIQGGWIHTPYETWLRQIFDDTPIEPGDPTERFWHRHHHAQLAARWADILGPENVTVIIADPHDRHALLRPFETMLGLPTGLLDFEPGPVNESLPANRIELLRRINAEFDERGWDDAAYGKLIRHGATARMHITQESSTAENPIHTPRWAHDRAVEIGNRIADDLGELGVRIAGDLDNLGSEPERPASSASGSPAMRTPTTNPTSS